MSISRSAVAASSPSGPILTEAIAASLRPSPLIASSKRPTISIGPAFRLPEMTNLKPVAIDTGPVASGLTSSKASLPE